MKPRGQDIMQLSADDIRNAAHGCDTRTEVLDRLGLAHSGKSFKRLDARAIEMGVVLPGKPYQGVQASAPIADNLYVKGWQRDEGVLPPSKRSSLTFTPPEDDVLEGGESPVGAEHSRFQAILDALDAEIIMHEVEIEKIIVAQASIKSLRKMLGE